MPDPPKRLEDVFKTVGLPRYTYVKPTYFGEVKSDILSAGRHLLIEGPSGIGKTCVVYKVFEELEWTLGTEYAYVSCRDRDAQSRVTQFFDVASEGGRPIPSLLVIDDFHLLNKTFRGEIGAALKRLSDRSFEDTSPPKVILIGIPTAGTPLLTDALDLGPRLGGYRFSQATDSEIDRLITEGELALNVLFEDRPILLSESAGNFWLAQYVCNKICAMEEVFVAGEDVRVLTFDLLTIRQRLMTELTQRYLPVARAFAKGKRWRPGGNKPYLEVLLGLSRIPESVVSFDKILTLVPERRRPGIKAIRYRISEVIHDPDKEIDLRKQLAFDPDSGFSIEDPLFRYFLSHLDEPHLLLDLGIEAASMDLARVYSYDVGFSFAGEVRPLVEMINAELKAEDVVTFYDFDQQAVLLALDLQPALERIYTASCRYYLVFLNASYKEKIWTRWEHDILTHSGRTAHIIPVILDEAGATGIVGVPSTIGHIDLKDVISAMLRDGMATDDTRTSIRNRCVLPMLQKLDDWSEGITLGVPVDERAPEDSARGGDVTEGAGQGHAEDDRRARIDSLREKRRRSGTSLFPELDSGRGRSSPNHE
ncbi:MAG: hypothetical protein QOD83_2207 [Solirubrobacteraceae bacterium]|jgi:hypothetical protein|nr:hypothetical protein [Solirubrobacteraceae bacterium]